MPDAILKFIVLALYALTGIAFFYSQKKSSSLTLLKWQKRTWTNSTDLKNPNIPVTYLFSLLCALASGLILRQFCCAGIPKMKLNRIIESSLE